MTPAEFFKSMIDQRKYSVGAFMCHVIEDNVPSENWCQYKEPIDDFIRELDYMGHDGTLTFFDSIALSSAVSRAAGRVVRKEVEAGDNSEEKLERLCEVRQSDAGDQQVWSCVHCIYSDWDNRMMHLNAYIDFLRSQTVL